jgi:hypothetical protein
VKEPIGTLDRKVLKKFLKLAGDRLQGDWVLIGGTVLIALEAEHRSTVDIDIVGLGNPTQEDTLRLMEIAEELRLPVESINQAGAFFLKKIDGFKKHLVPLHEGKTASIHRPDAVLYFRLKLARLTESDLADCIAFLRFASREERKELKRMLAGELDKMKDEGPKLARLKALAARV